MVHQEKIKGVALKGRISEKRGKFEIFKVRWGPSEWAMRCNFSDGERVDTTLRLLWLASKDTTIDHSKVYRGGETQLTRKLFCIITYYHFNEIQALLLVYFGKLKRERTLHGLNDVHLLYFPCQLFSTKKKLNKGIPWHLLDEF